MKTRQWIFCGFLTLLTSLSGGLAHADESDSNDITPPFRRYEVTLSGGTALQTGYLTSKRSEGTYDVGLNFRTPRGLLSVEWQGFNANHNTGEFDLANNTSVSVATISLISHFQVFETEKWRFYLGLGVSDIFLSQTNPTYQLSYGTVIFSGMIEYQFCERWAAFYKTQWYNMEQTLAGETTTFEVWSHLVGVGFNF